MDLHVLARQAVNMLLLPFFQKYTINAYIFSYCIFQAAIVQQTFSFCQNNKLLHASLVKSFGNSSFLVHFRTKTSEL